MRTIDTWWAFTLWTRVRNLYEKFLLESCQHLACGLEECKTALACKVVIIIMEEIWSTHNMIEDHCSTIIIWKRGKHPPMFVPCYYRSRSTTTITRGSQMSCIHIFSLKVMSHGLNFHFYLLLTLRLAIVTCVLRVWCLSDKSFLHPYFFPMFVLSFLHGTPSLIHGSTYHFHRSLIGLSFAHIPLPFYKSPTLWSEALVYQVFIIFFALLRGGGFRCGCDEFSIMSIKTHLKLPQKELCTRNPKNLNLLF
jgi:hypothetical protein